MSYDLPDLTLWDEMTAALLAWRAARDNDAVANQATLTAANTAVQTSAAIVAGAVSGIQSAAAVGIPNSVQTYVDLPLIGSVAAGTTYLVRATGSVFSAIGGQWVKQFSISQPPFLATNGGRTSDLLVADIRAMPFDVTRSMVIDRVRIYVAVRHLDAETTTSGTNLMELVIYDAAGNKVASTEVQEIPEIGWVEFGLPPTRMVAGRYYGALVCNNTTTAKFGRNDTAGGVAATQAFPGPAMISLATPAASVSNITVLEAAPLQLAKPLVYRVIVSGQAVVYGSDVSSGYPWGFKQLSGCLAKSIDGGATLHRCLPLADLRRFGQLH